MARVDSLGAFNSIDLICVAIVYHRRSHVLGPGWRDLSRMKGNFHVRFLEGDGLATARPYSVTFRLSRAYFRVSSQQEQKEQRIPFQGGY
jgi:hypothetical protein